MVRLESDTVFKAGSMTPSQNYLLLRGNPKHLKRAEQQIGASLTFFPSTNERKTTEIIHFSS